MEKEVQVLKRDQGEEDRAWVGRGCPDRERVTAPGPSLMPVPCFRRRYYGMPPLRLVNESLRRNATDRRLGVGVPQACCLLSWSQAEW